MLLTSSLGSKIVNEVGNLIDEHLIIANPSGIIIASTDSRRVGDFHEGAQLACLQRKERIITVKDESILQGVKAGINLPIFFNNNPIGVIGITGEPAKVTPFGSLVKRMTELFIQENFFFQQMEWETRALDAFVLDWLQNSNPSDDHIQKGTFLGIDMKALKRCTLIQLEFGNGEVSHELIHYAYERLNDLINGTVARWGRDKFVILHNESEHSQTNKKYYHYLFDKFSQYITSRFQVSPYIGIGPTVSINKVNQSFLKAKKALTTSRQNNVMVFYQDLRLEICLQDILPETRKEFIDRSIGSLLVEKELINTLKVYYTSNLNLVKTAKELNVHINTIHYRLKKINEITSLDPKEVESLVTLYLSLIFLEESTNIT